MGSIRVDTVYVFFTKRNTLLSKIISKVTSSEYTHAGFIVNNIIYDCQKSGVEKHTIDEWYVVNSTYESIDVFDVDMYIDINQLIAICEKNINIKYDVFSLFNHLFYNYLGFWIRKINPEKLFTCSEFVAYVLYFLTKNIKFINNYKMSPKDLFDTKKFNYSHTIKKDNYGNNRFS